MALFIALLAIWASIVVRHTHRKTGKVWTQYQPCKNLQPWLQKQSKVPVKDPLLSYAPTHWFLSEECCGPAKGTGLIDSPLHHVKTKSLLSDRRVETGMESQIGFYCTLQHAADTAVEKDFFKLKCPHPPPKPSRHLRSPPALLMVPTLGWMCPLCTGSKRG